MHRGLRDKEQKGCHNAWSGIELSLFLRESSISMSLTTAKTKSLKQRIFFLVLYPKYSWRKFASLFWKTASLLKNPKISRHLSVSSYRESCHLFKSSSEAKEILSRISSSAEIRVSSDSSTRRCGKATATILLRSFPKHSTKEGFDVSSLSGTLATTSLTSRESTAMFTDIPSTPFPLNSILYFHKKWMTLGAKSKVLLTEGFLGAGPTPASTRRFRPANIL